MAQSQIVIGEKLGSFRVDSVLGSGAMGIVYRGTNEKSGRAAAVKVVSGEFAQGGKIKDRFEREAKILEQFRHPNIVRFLAYGRFRGTLYIAMEYIQGDTLDKIIQDRGHLPWREVVDLGIQMCDALHYAHEHGVVHRDFKPSNLMLSTDGKIKLTDFGIAKDLDATALTATGRTLGTAAYMSPEQIRGTPAVSHKTDLYALGIVLYQMLVGKPPFEGNTPVVLMHCHLNESPPRPSGKLAEIPKRLDELIVSLMAKSPTDRPWDAAAVGGKLTELHKKADKGAAVKMVWPSADPNAVNPRRSEAVDDAAIAADPAERSRKKTRKTGSTAGGSRSTQHSRSRFDSQEGSFWLSRSMIETGLLALALVAIGGFIAYLVWPPSQEYLYKHAEALMVSSRRADWMTALDEYIKPLDERFKSHPYHEQTQKWRDKILLDEAEGRGKNLASGLDISLTRPANNAEEAFVLHNKLASIAHERGDDFRAIRDWKEFAQQMKPDEADERKWHLLALRRVEQIENDIKDRRTIVEEQLHRANIAELGGRPNDALTIRSQMFKAYSRFTDLADIFPPGMADPGAEAGAPGPAESKPGERPESPPPSPPNKPADVPTVTPPPQDAAPPRAVPDTEPTKPPPPSQREPRANPDPSVIFWKPSNTLPPNSVVLIRTLIDAALQVS